MAPLQWIHSYLDRLNFTTSLVLDISHIPDTLTILGNQIFDYMIRRFRFPPQNSPYDDSAVLASPCSIHQLSILNNILLEPQLQFPALDTLRTNSAILLHLHSTLTFDHDHYPSRFTNSRHHLHESDSTVVRRYRPVIP